MKSLIFFLISLFPSTLFAQGKTTDTLFQRPKLVVGIMLDQMRWDYLYRYYDNYADDGGFKRLLSQGYSCENTLIPYAQTVTAVGHSSVYTGSVPAFTGIIANKWYDKKKGREVYCTEDDSVNLLSGALNSRPMSPKNLWVTTVGDELRLATNFKSKVIGVAIKDRASILPSGHSANGAFWYDDKNGNWVTSTYYMEELPKWVKDFNNRNLVDSFYRLNWNTLLPLYNYTQSSGDNKSYERPYNAESTTTFPHQLDNQVGKDYKLMRATPYGNTFTLMMAKEALINENLGQRGETDFLNVSLSSTDVIGHMYGPNSVEIEDVYRRVDRDLGDFFAELDSRIGEGNYLVFLTADHGGAHIPGFLNENKLPGQAVGSMVEELNEVVFQKFGVKDFVTDEYAYQIYLDENKLDDSKMSMKELQRFIIDYLNNKDEVYLAFDTRDYLTVNLPVDILERFRRGFNPKLSGDIQVILKPGSFFGEQVGTNHGLWYPYDSHIPLIFYGWKIKPGQLNREVYMTDIAATVAALLHIQMPSGCIGKPIYEVMQ